jgi:hypothetical protein
MIEHYIQIHYNFLCNAHFALTSENIIYS